MILYLLHSTSVPRPGPARHDDECTCSRVLKKGNLSKNRLHFFPISLSLSSFSSFDFARSFDFDALMILNTFKFYVYFFILLLFLFLLQMSILYGDLFIIGMCAYFASSKKERVYSTAQHLFNASHVHSCV